MLIVFPNCYTKHNFSIGNPRACTFSEDRNPLKFEVLPGFGWDNLVNENRGIVVNLNYSQCRTTEDGRYLIPDSLQVYPIKSSRMNVFSSVYDHWSDYKSDTSASINAGGSFKGFGFKIAASMSTEFQQVKSKQLENNATTTKVQASVHRYTAKVHPDAELDQVFRNRVLRIADHVQHKRKMSARYESELLIRDFGTHVLTSVDAGASIVKQDHVKSSFSNSKIDSKLQISLAASFSHSGFFHKESGSASEKFSISQDFIKQYINNTTDSEIRTHGGPVINPDNFTLDEWTSQIADDLVVIDRNGFSLENIITPQNFPEVPESLLQEIAQNVNLAINRYLLQNTYPGCTDPNVPNFSKIANADDGSCSLAFSKLSFGGVYQECHIVGDSDGPSYCDELTIKNPHTGSFSCPVGFEPVLLQSGQIAHSPPQISCHRCWIFFKCCYFHPHPGPTVEYRAHWCRSNNKTQDSTENGFLFGGLYTTTIDNFVTGSQSCPPFFLPMKITPSVFICISDEYELAAKSSIPFAGFYRNKCSSSLMNDTGAKSCPNGYSGHLAYTDDTCEVMYCIRTAQQKIPELKFPSLKSPPFSEIPHEEFMEAAYMITEDSKVWTKLIDPEAYNIQPADKKWTTMASSEIVEHKLRSSFKVNYEQSIESDKDDKGNKGLSKGAVAGVSVVTTTVFCVVVGIALSVWRTRKLKNNGYTSIQS